MRVLFAALLAVAVALSPARAEEGKTFIKTLKPNDEVDITYTEAVAVEVVPAPK